MGERSGKFIEISEMKYSTKRGVTTFNAACSYLTRLLLLLCVSIALLSSNQVAAAQSINNARSLGTVTVLTGPYICDSDLCYDLEVTCPDLSSPGSLTLKISEATGSPELGTIIFFTGWTGTFYWSSLSTEAPRVLSELRAAGYRTVQAKWASNWWIGSQGMQEGYAQLACKAATVMKWAHENLLSNPSMVYCATGHSNGASEVAYTISQYGQADMFSAVLLDAGPNYARLDRACIQDDPGYSSLWYDDPSRIDVDKSFGYLIFQQQEPCYSKNASYISMFQDASLAYGNWQFIYPKTMIGFTFGSIDTSTTKYHGMYFYNHLVQSGTPHISLTTVPNTDHTTVATVAGANAIRDFLINQCVPRSPNAVNLLSFDGSVAPHHRYWLVSPVAVLGLIGIEFIRKSRKRSTLVDDK